MGWRTIKNTNPNIIRLFNHPRIWPSFIHALYGYKSRLGFVMAKIKDGMPIYSDQVLKEWPPIKGKIHPIKGECKTKKKTEFSKCFLGYSFSLINLIQILVSSLIFFVLG